MVDLSELNPDQLAAAMCEGHTLAIAAPGSGKTKMLSLKAAFLLSKGHRVVAVTFTRDAAHELLQRTLNVAGQDALPRLLVGTFHSINMLMCFPSRAKTGLGREILTAGYSKLREPWTIVKEGDRRSFVSRAIDAAKLDLTVADATSLIERVKTDGVKPSDDAIETLCATYQELLDRQGNIDFLDILLKTNAAIAAGQVSPLQTDFLMLDEFQDTDQIQYDWMRQHALASSKVTCVGDDDQSIYGFRRALGYTGMQKFADEFRATRIVLGTNYRSHSEILRPADDLIKCNLGRNDKALVAAKGPGGAVEWEKFQDKFLEAEACAEAARQATAENASFVVLSRTNRLLDAIELEFTNREIEHFRTSDTGSLLDLPAVAAVIAAVGCLVYPNDLKLVDKVLAWIGIGEADIRQILQKLWPVAEIISKAALAKLDIDREVKMKVFALALKFRSWRALLDGGDALITLGMGEMLAQYATSPYESDMAKLGLKLFETEMPLKQRYMRLMNTIAEKRSKTQEGKLVTLMTAHGSKGLEFDRVWIVGAQDETFPAKSGQNEEERRLMYVAMTRARKQLVISAAGSKRESPFIGESKVARAAIGKYQTHPR